MTDDRYTVRMLHAIAYGFDINGVCRMVRDSLEKGIIPMIEIDTDHAAEREEREEIAQELRLGTMIEPRP